MRLGERPDLAMDRVRGFLRQTYTRLSRHGPRLVLFTLLLLLVGGAGVAGGIALAGFSGSLDNPDASNGLILATAGLTRTLGLYPHEVLLIASGIRNVNVDLPSHVVQGAFSNPARIELDIAEIDYQRLAYEREVALRQGIWLPSDTDYVPITIRYGDQTLHGKARLKGDWYDHWYGEKWSLRFKLDGDDRLNHMREFALQAPLTRNYMAEWLFQQTLAREGLSGLSYGFVDVTLNGKPMGTYAIEEAFDDAITSYNHELPGPLVRFSDTEFWASRVASKEMPDAYQTVVLDAFGGSGTNAGYSEVETAAALRLLEQWRNGEIPTRDAFDIDRTARYFALSDLLGNLHGDIFHNMRFYYNPISARLEPVGHDANAGEVIQEIKGLTTDPYLRLFFDDPRLTERYLAELDRVSADGYLETLFAELDPGIRANVSIIYRDQPFYYLDRQPYFDNRAIIQRTLHPYRAVSAYINVSSGAGPVIDLGASQPVPVEVTAVLAGGIRAVPVQGSLELPGKVPGEPVRYQTVAFTPPSGGVWDATAPVEVECRVLGTTESRLENVASTPRLPGAADAGALMRLPSNAESIPFAVTDDARRTVSLLQGSHRLAEPLIVPEGYTLRCGPNTTLDLVQNASIVARGPLDWVGVEESPITVRSTDGTGGGVIVLRARNLSTVVNVRFESLASPGTGQGSGATMTFLESPATFAGVSIKGGRTAPLLRLEDSPFNVTGSVFSGGSGAAVSVEYSEGNFSQTLIVNGSGLRVFGSVVGLERCHFEDVAGTAILAERESTLFGTGITCIAAGTALASETGSTATVDDLTMCDATVGVRSGKGETGYQAGTVQLRWARCSNVTAPYLQEGDGSITVDGRRPDR